MYVYINNYLTELFFKSSHRYKRMNGCILAIICHRRSEEDRKEVELAVGHGVPVETGGNRSEFAVIGRGEKAGLSFLQGSLPFHPTDHGDLQPPRSYHHFSVAFCCSCPVSKAGPCHQSKGYWHAYYQRGWRTTELSWSFKAAASHIRPICYCSRRVNTIKRRCCQ